MSRLFSKNSLFNKRIITFFVMVTTTILASNFSQKADAFSVCGLSREHASFKTKSYLITICSGEASLQMVKTFWDGTGYQRIPVEREGRKFRGSDDRHNYILDSKQLLIGTDGEKPVIEKVLQHKF